MLKALMDKIDGPQEHRDIVSWEIGVLRKTSPKMLKTENTVTEMKKAFDGCLVVWTLERMFELEGVSVGTSKTEKQREKQLKKE